MIRGSRRVPWSKETRQRRNKIRRGWSESEREIRRLAADALHQRLALLAMELSKQSTRKS